MQAVPPRLLGPTRFRLVSQSGARCDSVVDGQAPYGLVPVISPTTDLTVARPDVACVPLSFVPCLYSKRAALTRGPRLVFHDLLAANRRMYDTTLQQIAALLELQDTGI